MPTIKDVAKLANVSIATVSNVINNSSKVKDSTRARVLQAIDDLGYELQISEKENRLRQTGIIGVIMEDATIFNTPEIYTGICEAAQEAGYNVLAYNLALVHITNTLAFDEVTYCEPAQRAVNLLLSKNAEAIIYIGSQCREIRHISDGYGSETPFIYAYCYSYDDNTASVIYDDEEITYQLISYLIQNNHKSIGIIAGPQSGDHVRLRLTGYQRALFDAGILYNPSWVFHGNWDDESFGYSCAEKLVNCGVSAIFCMNDMLAGGAIDFMHDHDISIPEKLSIVGFDNIAASSAYYPKLTTVALPLLQIGRESVACALRLLHRHAADKKCQIISMPCRIVFRNSVLEKKAPASHPEETQSNQ